MPPLPENEASISRLVTSLRLLVRAIYVDSARMSRQYGLTSAQSGVLRTIYKNGALSSADLSRRLHVTPSNITGIIDRLGKKGLVERIPLAHDRRVVRIHLTAEGHSLGEALPDPIEKKLIASLSHMPPDQIRQLCKLTRHLLKAIDADAEIDAPLDFPNSTAATFDL